MSKHTPGPWKIRNHFDSFGDNAGIATIYVSDESGKWITRFEVPCSGKAEVNKRGANTVTEANARLIAAAPDMLEALKELHSEGCESDAFPGRPCSLCSLLARIEGRDK